MSQNTAELEEPDLPIIVPNDVKDKEAFQKRIRKEKGTKL